MIPDTILQQIKEKIQIEDIISEFISLKKRGVNFIGHCPFHEEKTPSFTVSPSRNSFKCFGCGKSGDVIAFVQEHEAFSFVEAVEFLAKKCQVIIPEKKLSEKEKQQFSLKKSLQIVTNFANSFFKCNLNTIPNNGFDYLTKERKFSPKTINKFQLGYAIESWDNLKNEAQKQQYKEKFLIETGLLGKSESGRVYDRFRNRIIFPIFDITGNTVGFTGRLLEVDKKQPKYLLTNNSEVFDKSNSLFGLFQARKAISKQNNVYLVEGQTDVLRMYELGLENTVCTSGTALSKNQIKLLKRFCNTITILFDGDSAGQNASLKSIDKIILNGMNVYVCSLPGGEDADSFGLKSRGEKLLEYFEANTKDFVYFKAEKLNQDKLNASQKANAFKEIVKTISLFSDNQTREFYIRNCAKLFDLNEFDIKKQVQALFINKEQKTDCSLFAFEYAKQSIKENDICYLLQDHEKVIEYHLDGKTNTVGINHSISIDAIKQLGELTKYLQIDDYISDIFEDSAEVNIKPEVEIVKTIKGLISKGFEVSIRIDEDDRNESHWSFVDFYIQKLVENISIYSDTSKRTAIERSAEILSFLSETERMIRIDFVKRAFNAQNIKFSTTDFKKVLNSYLKKNKREEQREVTIYADNPNGLTKQQLEDQNKYQFYEKDNQMYFETREGINILSNFVIKPLFHIISTNATRKLFMLTNNEGQETIIEVDMDAMVRHDKFLECAESKGNYVFWGSKNHFVRLKRKLYDDTRFCQQIDHLGWQKGFWAWSDGIVVGKKFLETDEYGIVEHNKTNYYIPAFSKLYDSDSTVFRNERKFRRLQQNISLQDWTNKFVNVFGANAKLSFCAWLTALFSDFVFAVVGSIPVINLFGVKGTGKTEHAKSLLWLFGEEQSVLNVHKSTEYACSVHVENFKNAIAGFDEYKNSIDVKRVEFLKGLYNRQGRSRGSIKKGVKLEEIAVNSLIFLCGQEMPTADVALFSRLVFLPYYSPQHSDQQKSDYNELKNIEKKGLTHLTEEILQYREIIEKEYENTFYEIEKELSEKLLSNIDDRLIRNYATILAVHRPLRNRNLIPLESSDLITLSCKRIKEQYNIMNSSNELAGFWNVLVALLDRAIINEGTNFKIENVVEEKLLVEMDGSWTQQDFNWSNTSERHKKILYLRWESLYSSYAELAAKTKQEIMPETSLRYYLEHCQAFLGKKKNKRFHGNVYQSLCFDYELIGVNLIRNLEEGKNLNSDAEQTLYDPLNNKPKSSVAVQSELPF